jgi:hypothetical protein
MWEDAAAGERNPAFTHLNIGTEETSLTSPLNSLELLLHFTYIGISYVLGSLSRQAAGFLFLQKSEVHSAKIPNKT